MTKSRVSDDEEFREPAPVESRTVIRWTCWGVAAALLLLWLGYMPLGQLQALPAGLAHAFVVVEVTLVLAGLATEWPRVVRTVLEVGRIVRELRAHADKLPGLAIANGQLAAQVEQSNHLLRRLLDAPTVPLPSPRGRAAVVDAVPELPENLVAMPNPKIYQLGIVEGERRAREGRDKPK